MLRLVLVALVALLRSSSTIRFFLGEVFLVSAFFFLLDAATFFLDFLVAPPFSFFALALVESFLIADFAFIEPLSVAFIVISDQNVRPERKEGMLKERCLPLLVSVST